MTEAGLELLLNHHIKDIYEGIDLQNPDIYMFALKDAHELLSQYNPKKKFLDKVLPRLARAKVAIFMFESGLPLEK